MGSDKQFIYRNLLKGLIWLFVLIVGYILFKRYVSVDYLIWLRPLFDNKLLMLLIFLLSEVVLGIIPPEIFIIWALRTGQLANFFVMVTILATISYGAGVTGYFFGHYLSRTLFFRVIKRRFLRKLDSRLETFGIYLILIAAMTPLPFSGVSMLIGYVRFPLKRFLLFSLTRFLRFFLYAVIFWNIDPVI
jgi:membrane protein DedA with SNARE-associated domain